MGLPDEVIAADRALSEHAEAMDAGITTALARMTPIERVNLFVKLNDDWPLSIRQMALAFGCSPSTIMRSLHRKPGYDGDEEGKIVVRKSKGRDGKIRPNRRFDTTERDNQILALHEAGESMRTIAAKAGCSVGTVHRVIHSL